MPAAKPPSRKPAPKLPAPEAKGLGDGTERTDPGGPAPEVLQQARRDFAGVRPGAGEATLIYHQNQARGRAADAPRLLVTAGPRKGTEHTLAGELTTIGRGEANVFVIPDIAVSRQHSRIEKQDGRWVVLDQGSGNGTRVNGKPVERYPLRHGDEIEMGDTRLEFVESGGVLVKGSSKVVRRPLPGEPQVTGNQAPLAAKSAWKRHAPLYGAILVGLAIVFAAGLVRRNRELRREAEAAAQGDRSRAFAQKRFQEGVALLKSGKWVEARDKLQIAAELNAQDPEIARYLESAEAEAPRAQQLATARAVLARKAYASAREALALVPDESTLAASAPELSHQLRTALDTALSEAKSRAEAGDAAGAQELLDPVLAAEPARADALAVKEALSGQRRAVAASDHRRQRTQQALVATAAAPDVQGILEAYLAGDLGAAIERAQSAGSPRGERLLADLKIFEAAYQDGLAKQRARRTAEALRALEQASAVDRNIAEGKDGRLSHEVRKALSALHMQLGAEQAGGDEGLPQSAAHFRDAVQNDPSNDGAQAELRQIGDRCKEIYLRGYVAKDGDIEAARKSFKLVIETLPASDETAQKAKRWLDKLDGKVSKDE